MDFITRKILEHIINRLLRNQNEFTDLFLGEINTEYQNALTEVTKESKEGIYLCGWYYFVIKNNKNDSVVKFHIAKCA